MADKTATEMKRKSNLFYISCSFIDSICQDDFRIVPLPSDTITIDVEQEKANKRRNRKSKLFYVSCDYVDVNNSTRITEVYSSVQSEARVLYIRFSWYSLIFNLA